ncbi:DUF6328 family protein [Paenarthrobacter sp. PH39-S1]|uniref:DUF6328 family protein n=1 Tax=Paenarthrobacter sp. PH39-S1 TaxID=3046204 RepID=UPI0024B9E73B|nr:DUF6328 family protein [Paenarthrobacter sp. PH39-S1]MDJ0356742.1 DUF6328 family protein [Paenarthrobacter sp. PH39-S1]
MNPEKSIEAPRAGDGRHETRDEQLDRNWSELLQELRVMQTGVQIIAGFLLTLPFQQRFTTLDTPQRGVFLFLVVVSAVATALMLAPVSLHRRLFRHHVRETLVASGDRIVKIVLGCVALLIAGTGWLVFSVVVGPTAGNAAGAALLAVIILLLLVFPLVVGRRHRGRDL